MESLFAPEITQYQIGQNPRCGEILDRSVQLEYQIWINLIPTAEGSNPKTINNPKIHTIMEKPLFHVFQLRRRNFLHA